MKKKKTKSSNTGIYKKQILIKKPFKLPQVFVKLLEILPSCAGLKLKTFLS